ncbi:tryptophan synthase subunit beta [Paractinoplanes hotanensis]|uniref:Tryptophan synthase beta chain n=1 Tax=Paractinoplanes hotanensis TaxID=2906497 RepID=A0ABT0Y4Z4_9ACTN|nr:tryptophan synthase subunit beta [Actinoplanes hotanensis]MCM4081106.1 tryptophan synthase subunit beta [Actinoplanes hotanensis]
MPGSTSNHVRRFPDAGGYYGDFGGNHWPPHLKPALQELAAAYEELRSSPAFLDELDSVRTGLQGRPTPVHYLENISKQLGGARIYVKREDLNHTGAHKINHCVGFALLARKMGKRKLIAETGAGQHGVALASAAARFELDCEVHIGAVDVDKVNANVSLMRLLGARVVPAASGQATLKEASDSALRAYTEQHADALYAIGSAIGPHPFPMIVRDFQSVIGQEARAQFLSITGGRLPDHVVACVAGGSNALGMYSGFLDDPEVALHAVEPLGKDARRGQHAATLTFGRPGTLHGTASVVLQEDDGRPAPVRSIASGLAYPGVGPEIAMLCRSGRVSVDTVSDEEAVATFLRIARHEGIIPALESAHALAFAIRLAETRPPTERILVNLSGRGDKDVDFVLAGHGGGSPNGGVRRGL